MVRSFALAVGQRGVVAVKGGRSSSAEPMRRRSALDGGGRVLKDHRLVRADARGESLVPWFRGCWVALPTGVVGGGCERSGVRPCGALARRLDPIEPDSAVCVVSIGGYGHRPVCII
ncbi:hypothetical protein JCM33774_13090 [Actinophytocola sp. KF-1]